jgi:hypothetical protein
MFSATAYKIREARVDDVPELVRLGWATEEEWPTGLVLVGEIHGVVAGALAVDENRSLMADVPNAPHLLTHMRLRAAGIVAYRHQPSVAERIREQMRGRVAVAA